MRTRPLYIGLGLLVCGAITFGAFALADSLQQGQPLYEFIRSSGYLGIVLIAVISGLNPFLPLPPATFAPIFLESGFAIYTIIGGFVIGTTIADSIGYALGWFGRGYADTTFPELTERIHTFLLQHTHFILPVAFLYFAFAPLPNELILIPLALTGYKYQKLIIPIILGNIAHHTVLVYGYGTVFNALF